MDGIWFAAVVTALVMAGVVAQLGWELPSIPAVKRVLRLVRDTQRDTPRSVGGPP
jgi:hypothetical protein